MPKHSAGQIRDSESYTDLFPSWRDAHCATRQLVCLHSRVEQALPEFVDVPQLQLGSNTMLVPLIDYNVSQMVTLHLVVVLRTL